MFLVKSLLRLRSCMTSLTSLSPGLPWTHPAHPALTGWRGRPPRGEDSEGQKSSFWAQDSWGVLDEGIRACLNLVPDLPPSHIYMANATHYGTIKAGKSRNKKKASLSDLHPFSWWPTPSNHIDNCSRSCSDVQNNSPNIASPREAVPEKYAWTFTQLNNVLDLPAKKHGHGCFMGNNLSG